MKYIIIAIAFITTLNLSAQDNFSLTEGKVTWQKVYETKKSKEQLFLRRDLVNVNYNIFIDNTVVVYYTELFEASRSSSCFFLFSIK